MNSDDGYASPENGRRRHKAGPKFARAGDPSSWWPYIGMGVAGIVLLGMIAFGFAAGIKYLDNRDTAGSQWTNVMTSCVPLNHTASHSFDFDTSDIVGTTVLDISRTHHVVTASITFVVGGSGTISVGDNFFSFYIDSRCIPPSESFAPCTDPCPEPDDLEPAFLIDNIAAQLPLHGSVYIATGFQSAFTAPTASLIEASQSESNGVNWYGVNFDVPTEFSQHEVLFTVTFTMMYVTNASSTWRIPEYCTNGPCPNEWQ